MLLLLKKGDTNIMKKISKNYASASVVEVNETLKEFEILKRKLL